ncbi:hypothetical protein [Thermosipho sp. 1074]|uniref:hypothetical protein n=1 Tax=Thermosipho sp. 1074 TaxID=1643331 RepID=UPI00098754F8|nr:hypothetical protein [Thermosipho sp. 1074]
MQIATVFNQFWRLRLDFDLKATEIGLFFAILSEINRARAENNDLLSSKVKIGSRKLELLSGISRAEIYRIRNKLRQYGLIEFENGKGKKNYAVYYLGKIFKELSQSETVSETDNLVSHTETVSETVSETLNETVSETLSETRNKNKEYRIENIDSNSNKESQENTNVFSFDSATNVANEPPKWYLNLDDRKKDIVDTWRTLIGPFDPKWLSLVSQVLRECYPAQIKNAIVTLAKTKADVMQEQGFEYIVEPLLKGVFGKRTKRKKKTSTGFASKLTGLKQFLEEGEESA